MGWERYRDRSIEIYWHNRQTGANIGHFADDIYYFIKNKTIDKLIKDNVIIIMWLPNFDINDLWEVVEPMLRNGTIVVIHQFNPHCKTIEKDMHLFNLNFTGSSVFAFFTFKKKVKLSNNNFFGNFMLTGNKFEDGLIIENNKFMDGLSFENNEISNLVLSDINFINENGEELKNNSEILEYYKGLYNGMNAKINRQSCNFIKNHFMQQNNYIDSNIFYALEMLARGIEVKQKLKGSLLERLVFDINEETSNHGQSIELPIFHILMLALTWALVDIFLLKNLALNMDYFIGIAFPIKDLLDNSNMPCNDWGKLAYIISKVFSAVLWWQLIRAIRKDIKR